MYASPTFALTDPDSGSLERPFEGGVVAELSRCLAGFSTAAPSLLARRDLLRRIDTKFLVSEAALPGLLGRLHGEYAVLCAGSARIAGYRTLYFDTPELRCFHDHRRGRRPRQKVRIRHYPDRRVSFLEVKTKRSESLTDKRRIARPYGDHRLGPGDRRFLAEACELPLEELRPMVWTNFGRISLVGLHTVERVTIDVGLTVVNENGSESLDGVAIMEVKQSPFCAHTPVMSALREEGQRPASASKYCIGVALTQDGVRLNRLLPTLRAVERLRG